MTAKTLDEVIIESVCIGPLHQTRERLYFNIKAFISNKFGVALLTENEDRVVVKLNELFQDIVRRNEIT
jgi:hypothetical protein